MEHITRMSKLKKIIRKYAKRIAKDYAFSSYLPQQYKKTASAPVDERKVLFLDTKGKTMPDSFKLLYKALTEEYTFEVKFIGLGQTESGLRSYLERCAAFAREAGTAKYIFLCDASDLVSCFPLRPETKVVLLWHACGAFKKWGMSTADLIFGGSREEILRHPFYKNLSLVTVSSPEVCWAYCEAMVLEDTPDIVQPIGVSRTDVFFGEELKYEAYDQLEKVMPVSKGRKIILYAPTFRGRVASAKGPDQLDIESMRDALNKEYVLLIKHHPFVKQRPAIPESCEDFACDVSDSMSIEQLLCISDICISDYSSLIFEYSLFERPMVFFAYDKADYNDWRGFYYDYNELTPGPVVTETKEIVDYIQRIDTDFDKDQVIAFKQKFMSACDGHSTERIMQQVFQDDLVRFRKPDAWAQLERTDPDGKDISIIIPAYNAMPRLGQALESIAQQHYPLNRIQVVVVDDASTDDTLACAQSYCRRYPDTFAVVHRGIQSGNPGIPRNDGMKNAIGKYLFFLDADDWLGKDAVRKMIAHAEEWNSDVLLVKMLGVGGRKDPQDMFDGNHESVDVYSSKVMWTFGPMKLFRREFIQANEIEFSSHTPEDIYFTLRAYVLASKVSVASDYQYYYCTKDASDGDSDGTVNAASASTWGNLASNRAAFDEILSFVDVRVPEDKRNDCLMRRIFRRDVYQMLMNCAKDSREEARNDFESIRSQFGKYYQSGMYETMPVLQRALFEAAISYDDYDLMKSMANCIDDRTAQKDISYCSGESKGVDAIYEINGKRMRFDVTHAIRARCKVSSIENNRSAYKIKGTFDSSPAMFDLPYQIVLSIIDGKGNQKDFAGEATIFRVDANGASASAYDYSAHGCWNCVVPADKYRTAKNGSRFSNTKAYLVLRLGEADITRKLW